MSRAVALLLVIVALVIVAPIAVAQPFGAWLVLPGNPNTAHARIPANAALNPTAAFTFEAWVAISNTSAGEDCRSIAGKNWLESWWIGLCTVGGKPTLRSYLRNGVSSQRNGGQIEPGRWTHVAVVFNGTQRLHYINGELAATFAETGAIGTSTEEMRIGSDVSWEHPPAGAINEVRLWSVARTQEQLRENLVKPITAPESGLIAVWSLSGSVNDIIGPHDGSTTGSGIGFLTFPVALNCGSTTTSSLCLLNRFSISARWRTDAPGTLTNDQAPVAGVANAGSGLFQFFSPDNWEIMVKALNGCGLNNRYWIFSAATTNVFYRMEVLDVRAGVQKIYFNYPGPPAPAVTDVNAFATCP